jgi:acetylornithine deacetylase
VVNSYPGLETNPDGEIAKFMKIIGNEKPIKVSFGTEGGLYQRELRFPTVVCGPGFMEQGHKPDEFISREQIARCDAMMQALIDGLAA